MKTFIYSFLVLLVITACGSETTEPENDTNTAPSIPSLMSPANNELCTELTLSFNWSAAIDDEGDAVTYQFQVATDANFTAIFYEETLSSTTKVLTLTEDKGYYWRVKAMDTEEASGDYTSVHNFYTEGEGVENHVPFAAELVSPVLGSSLSSGTTKLEWSATDLDGDSLLFDIYIGTAKDNLQNISTDLSDTELEVTTVASETYYWRVDVKDTNGASSVGQVWDFKTM